MKTADPLLNFISGEIALHGDELEWEVDSWVGKDLSKFWIKSEGERAIGEGETEFANIELSYSRAISPYWDFQFGIRHDFSSNTELTNDLPGRDWASIGFIGTASYFIDVDTRLFIGEESSAQLLVELERELMLTQRWVLIPELDIIVNGSSNLARQEGSGLANIDFELKLAYELDRNIEPFIGFSWSENFGSTKRLRQNNEEHGGFSALLGIEMWF